MYTQCPECEALFEITATDLAVAGGFVRCGNCSVSFDALNSLQDNPAISEAADPAPENAAAGDSETRQAELIDVIEPAASIDTESSESDDDDVENNEDEIKSGAEDELPEIVVLPVETAEPAETEVAALKADKEAESDSASAMVADDQDNIETGDDDDDDIIDVDGDNNIDIIGVDGDVDDDEEILLDENYQPPESDEDDKSVDDLEDAIAEDEIAASTAIADNPDFENFFDDSSFESETDQSESDAASAPDDTDSDSESKDDFDTPDEATAHVDEVDESDLFELPVPELLALEQKDAGVLPEKLEGGEAARDPSAQNRSAINPASALLEAARKVVNYKTTRENDAFDAEDARDLKDYLSAPVNKAVTAAWAGASLLMVLLLAAQIVHRNRGDLVIHPEFGPRLNSIYRVVGIELRPNWKIEEYSVVGQARLFEMPTEEQAKPDDATALRFVTIISNGAKLPQPAPMVRLTLRDRWGDPTGIRDFTPPEYLADRSLIGQLLEPGQRLRVVLNIADPGDNVVGFDFDMCLPDAVGTLRCANESGG